jgi:predicted N-formylglutamate amidohydrolase
MQDSAARTRTQGNGNQDHDTITVPVPSLRQPGIERLRFSFVYRCPHAHGPFPRPRTRGKLRSQAMSFDGAPRMPGPFVLLGEDDPPPFRATPGHASSPYVITCDHAGRRLPRGLGTLGLSAAEQTTHIAWDIGAAGLGARLAAELGGFLILQTYSRLVIDCNRPLGTPDSIVKESERVVIPGNRDVSPSDADARARAVFHPYHDRIRSELDRRHVEAEPTILVALHTFTPEFMGVTRPWHVGILYQRDVRLARAMLELLRGDATLMVGDNEPYAVSDLTDYGVVQHGERRGVPHVELEIRQDLVADDAGQARWAERMATALKRASTMSLL